MIETRMNGLGGLKRPKKILGLFKDPRNFKWQKKFGSVSELPTGDFDVWVPLAAKQQGNNQLCTDYMATGAAEAQFGVVLDEAFQRAAHNKIAGTPGDAGPADPMQAALAVVRVGALPKKDSPYNVDTSPPSLFADISKYPQNLVLEAGLDKEFSVYEVKTDFDSLRAALWQSKQGNFKALLMVGIEWGASWLGSPGGVVKINPNEPFTDHAFVLTGQKTINGVLYLKAHLSSGLAGDDGFFYFSRETSKFLFCYAYGPGSPTDNKAQLWGVLQKLFDLLYNIFVKKKMDNIPIDQTLPPPTPSPEYDWSNPVAARHSVRVICDEEGLTLDQKNTLCETVKCESGFDPKAINENKNSAGQITSRDYGLCQINDFFHIGPSKDFPSSDFVLNNPEACVRFMCKMWLAGKQNLWECYKKIYG